MMMTFGRFLEAQVMKVDIENLLPHKSDMEVAVHSLYNGRPSTDRSPIEVEAVGDGKYVVVNGHHRLLQAIIRGDATVPVSVRSTTKPPSINGTIPLDFYDGDYYGLDSSLENGWLIKRLH